MGQIHGLTKYDRFVLEACDHPADALPQTFGRLGPKNPLSGIAPGGAPFNDSSVAQAFSEVLDAMEDHTDPESDVGAGMTFLGQFIDHDITMDATSAIGTRIDPRSIRNVRTPALDLDCVYGDGPEASPWLYHPGHHGFMLYGTAANAGDLARNTHGTALIGDPRNDENQIVSQLHGAFVQMHNILMTALEGDNGMVPAAMAGIRARAMSEIDGATEMPFEAARRVLRLHYQWIILNDFLPAFVDAHVLKDVKHAFAKGGLPAGFDTHSPVMPIEFSGAAFRFGHATVQNEYHLNSDVGFVKLFEMGRDEFTSRPEVRNIEFGKLFDLPGNASFQKARPISRKLAKSIFHLPFIGSPLSIGGMELSLADSQKLPHRNIFRDRVTLELPSGQQMARLMNVAEIPAPGELSHRGITKTPLWYYCLHEAESFGGKLGPVGGTLVAGTLMRLMALDPESILCSAHDFQPWTEMGASQAGNFSLGHMLKTVEDKRGAIAHAADLITG
ncbi:peroxidase family protein [Tropicimonas sp. S265A]|uniref:peroxidase family protein n=1 Tax=Tropicimonas sp. S265A TaxID=3415134 RepID=UPI003C798606